MSYAAKNDRQLAEELGYNRTTNTQNGDTFAKHDKATGVTRRVWSVASHGSGDPSVSSVWEMWQTADIIGGSYRNHQKFTSLKEALERPAYSGDE